MNDLALPQLAQALDSAHMRGVVAAACLAPGTQLKEFRIGHVRYKPGRNCLIRYDGLVEGAGWQWWAGRVYEPGTSASRWQKAVDAAAHVEPLGLVLWAFPNERKLRGIAAMFDQTVLADALRVWRGAAAEADGPVTAELIRYVPEHGCTVRVTAGRDRYYVKIQAGGAGARTAEWERALGREAWFDARHGMLWQRELPGAMPDLETDLEACGRALARLHAHAIEGLAATSNAAGGGAGFEAARVLLAERGAEASAAMDEIERRWPACSGAEATLHGDLHLKNFLASQGEAELIDLDTLRRGDPLEDLGSFAASLYHRAALQGWPVERAESAIARFVSAYAARVPWNVDARDLATHTARALIAERACRSITRCKGDVVEPLVAQAARLLSDTRTAREWMSAFDRVARGRDGEILDIHYKTYRKAQSWKKSAVTVAWRDRAGMIRVERRGGGEPVSWTFPHDPAMPWLADVASVAGGGEMDVLNYRPESRLTARYNVGGARVVYGKTYADGRGELLAARLAELHATGFFMPPPQGYSAEVRTVWQEAFDGEPLMNHLDSPGAATLVAAAAGQLARLHRTSLRSTQPRPSLEDQHADLAKKLAKLAAVLPGRAASMEQLARTLGAALLHLEAADSAATVHGDFHVRQLMVKDGQVALFDFDETGVGDAMEDLGHFSADLHTYGWGQARVAEVRASFLSAYESATGRPIPHLRLAWHSALQVATRAYRALLQLRPDFDERAAGYLDIATHYAQGVRA